MTRHRLALIGCGDVAQRDYLPELHRLADRVELVAIRSRGEARARSVAEHYGASAWYTDYAALLDECAADLVANLTPIQSHIEITLAAQLELLGFNGTIAANLLDVAAPVEIFRKDGGWEQVQAPHARQNGPDHLLGIEHLIDCVDGRTAPVLSVEHAIHVVEIIEKAALAARDERMVTVESRFAPRHAAA